MLLEAPREVSSGMRLVSTAYMENADRVSAVARRRNGELRTTVLTWSRPMAAPSVPGA